MSYRLLDQLLTRGENGTLPSVTDTPTGFEVRQQLGHPIGGGSYHIRVNASLRLELMTAC